jgi:hypothetical protein
LRSLPIKACLPNVLGEGAMTSVVRYGFQSPLLLLNPDSKNHAKSHKKKFIENSAG